MSKSQQFECAQVALRVAAYAKRIRIAEFTAPSVTPQPAANIIRKQVLANPQLAASLALYDLQLTALSTHLLARRVADVAPHGLPAAMVALSMCHSTTTYLPTGSRGTFFCDYAGVAHGIRNLLQAANICPSDNTVWEFVADWRRSGALATLAKSIASQWATTLFRQDSCPTMPITQTTLPLAP